MKIVFFTTDDSFTSQIMNSEKMLRIKSQLQKGLIAMMSHKGGAL